MTPSTALLWINTVRHLKAVQIYWRVWRRVWRPIVNPAPAVSPRAPLGEWQACARAPRMPDSHKAEFLNRCEDISGPDIWNAPRLAKLWLYNLHYFDDLVADGHAERRPWHEDLIARWITENPPGTGNGWEPFPTSLRIVNWVKWHHADGQLSEAALESLAVQADWLSRNLEYHLLGNHLLANAKALVFAAAVFKGPAATRWRAKGLAVIDRELPSQMLPEGGHFERSTMYHAIFVEDLLDLVQLGHLDPAIPASRTQNWAASAATALRWLNGLTHPDGQIAFFNDVAFGIAPEPLALTAYAEALGIRAQSADVRDFDGYVRLEAGPALVLCDVAPIGPDHLPGHAHADTLSFEMSLGGVRLFGNGGTSVYGGDRSRRLVERGTLAQNTVSVDGQNSSEVWSDFRVARRARIVEKARERNGETITLTGAHDGFRRFGGPLHRRTWTLTDRELEIADELEGNWTEATARLRVLPGWQATPEGISGPQDIRITAEGARVAVEEGAWAPEFGAPRPCQILTFVFERPRVTVTLNWEA